MKKVEVADLPPLALFNVGGRFYATQDHCTHARASLTGSGRLSESTVECGWHFGTFDVTTGRALTAPCRRALKTYPTRIVDERVLIGIESSTN